MFEHLAVWILRRKINILMLFIFVNNLFISILFLREKFREGGKIIFLEQDMNIIFWK